MNTVLQKNIRMIVFDLDGTLLDSMGDFAVVASQVIQKYYDKTITEALEMYRQTTGLPFIYQLEKLFPQDPRNQNASDEYEKLKLKGYFEKPYFEDVLQVFPLLQKLGYDLVVSSNNEEQLVYQRVTAIKPYLKAVLGYHNGFLKGKAHFDHLKKNYHCRNEEFLFVGDSLKDALFAHENDIAFVARTGTFSKEEFEALHLPLVIVNNYFELIRLLPEKE